MSRLQLGVVVVAVSVGSLCISALPVSAHPVDELVQQTYITPTPTGIDIGVELEPGILVGPDFVKMLDADRDGRISSTETSANAAAVRDAIDVTVDGRPATLTLTTSIYPDADVLSAAGGSIALLFAVDAAFAGGPTTVTVDNAYTPLNAAGQPMTTTIQTNLTPAIDVPVTVAGMEHGNFGRSFAATYTLAAARTRINAGASPRADTRPPTTSDRPVAALTITFTAGLVAAAIYLCRRTRRRNRHLGQAATLDDRQVRFAESRGAVAAVVLATDRPAARTHDRGTRRVHTGR